MKKFTCDDSHINYREASIDDWSALADFRNLYSLEGRQTAKSRFNRDFANKSPDHQVLFIAEQNGKIVGYGRAGYFEPDLGEPIYGLLTEVPRGYYTQGVLVHESVRGRGVGIRLTELRAQWARQFDSKIYCILNRNNKVSVDMHIKIGFKEMKKNLKYPGDGEKARSGILYCREFD